MASKTKYQRDRDRWLREFRGECRRILKANPPRNQMIQACDLALKWARKGKTPREVAGKICAGKLPNPPKKLKPRPVPFVEADEYVLRGPDSLDWNGDLQGLPVVARKKTRGQIEKAATKKGLVFQADNSMFGGHFTDPQSGACYYIDSGPKVSAKHRANPGKNWHTQKRAHYMDMQNRMSGLSDAAKMSGKPQLALEYAEASRRAHSGVNVEDEAIRAMSDGCGHGRGGRMRRNPLMMLMENPGSPPTPTIIYPKHRARPVAWECSECGFSSPRSSRSHARDLGPCPRCGCRLWMRGSQTKRNPGASAKDIAKARKLRGFQEWMLGSPDFWPGIHKYIEFHGTWPKKIKMFNAPHLASKDEAKFLVGMGKALDTTYKTTDNSSNKHGSIYIHEFADHKEKPDDAELPDRACTPDGKALVTLGGEFEVKDWVRG